MLVGATGPLSRDCRLCGECAVANLDESLNSAMLELLELLELLE